MSVLSVKLSFDHERTGGSERPANSDSPGAPFRRKSEDSIVEEPMRHSTLAVLALVGLMTPARAATVGIPAARDTTLVEDPNGALANGAGPAIFAGRTAAPVDGVRRGLVVFDLVQELPAIPPSAMNIEAAALVLTNLTESNVAPAEYRLHRVLADWGEGTSSSSGGAGAAATPGDATWIHTFHATTFWMHNGAQFAGQPSARVIVSGAGVYRFEGDALLRDVRFWARHPEQNFGWILIGDETHGQTARAFASRENPAPALRPVLEITPRGRP
jgi:hypothetical protein